MYNREELLREKLIVDKSNKKLVESFVNHLEDIKTNDGDLNLSEIIAASEAAIKPSMKRSEQEKDLLQRFANKNGMIEVSEASKSLIPEVIKKSIIDYANIISNGEREKLSANSSRSSEYDKGLSNNKDTLTMLKSIVSSNELLNEVRNDDDLAYRLADPIKNESPSAVKFDSLKKVTKNRFMDFIREVNKEVSKLELKQEIQSELKNVKSSAEMKQKAYKINSKYSR